MVRMRISCLVVLLSFCFVTVSGCASYSPSSVRMDSFGSNAVKQMNGDLVLTVEEYVTKEKCQRAFDMDLKDDGVLPLLISIQNNGMATYDVKNTSIMVKNGSFSAKLLTPEEAAGHAKKNAVTRALGWSMIVPIISIPIAATASAIHTSNVNKQIINDFRAKSFPEGTILPNKDLAGFLFVDLEENFNDLSEFSLVVTAMRTDNNEPVTFTAPLPSLALKERSE